MQVFGVTEKVSFINNYWDKTTGTLVEKTEEREVEIISGYYAPSVLRSNKGEEKWYALKDDGAGHAQITAYKMEILGTIHLILMDGVELYSNRGIILDKNNTLHIYSQSTGTKQGKLTIEAEGGNPGIGSRNGKSGDLYVHGGYLDIEGGQSGGAAIGTGCCSDVTLDLFRIHQVGNIYVYGGTIKAHGGTEGGAGIGGGVSQGTKTALPGTYYQYGGDVTAWGAEYAAGVGGGGCHSNFPFIPDIAYVGGTGMDVCVYGGKLTAYGGRRAAGIGSASGNKAGNLGSGTLSMYGGTVYAQGGDYGAGIGSGCNGEGGKAYLYGGTLTAIGGKDGAGIGGGEDAYGGTVIVDGATVRAEGKGSAAGIGGGEGKSAYTFEYKRGTVVAIAGGDCEARNAKGGSAIGSGRKEKYKRRRFNSNVIKLSSECMVTAGDAENNIERTFTTSEREDACRWRNFVRLEQCDHKNSRYTYIDEKRHYRVCNTCKNSHEEMHSVEVGKDCICGKKYNAETDTWGVTVYECIDGKTYATGKEQRVVKSKSYDLPKPQDVEGLIFMGYIEATSAPSDIEMHDSEFSSIVDAGQSVTPNGNTSFYARYRYDYDEEWKWSDNCESATVKISNSLIGDTRTLTATIEEDMTEHVEPVDEKLGTMTFLANVNYERTKGVTYQFNDSYRTEFFKISSVELDAAAEDNEEVLEPYDDHMGYVSINNLTLKKDGKLHPICLPFSVTKKELETSPLAGATFYQLTETTVVGSQLHLSFKKVTEDYITAGQPYFVKWDKGSDIENPQFPYIHIQSTTPWDITDNLFELIGTYDMQAVDHGALNYGTLLMLNEDEKLVDVSGGMIDAFSNYLYIPRVDAEDGTTAVCSVRLSFEDYITVEKFITYGFDGEGTAENPYTICNARQLNDMAAYLNAGDEKMQGKHFKQGANITFDKAVENNFTPVNVFNGHYDGAGHIISGLNINKPGTEQKDDAALIVNMAENSTLKNVIIANSTITGRSAAALANKLGKSAVIDSCHVLRDVTIRSNHHAAAGLVAYIHSGSATLKNSTCQATVTSNQSDAAGIAGSLTGGTLTGCIYLGNSLTHATGAYHANPVAAVNNGGTINNCYYTDPSLSDNNAKLMPYIKDDNTLFLNLLHARDETLLKAGLDKEQIGYDLTINGREYKAVRKADETWSRRAFTLSLPFDMTIPDELHENVLVYRLHEIDLEKKEFVFTNDFPILKAGWPYILVVNKGSITFSAKNILVNIAPTESDIVYSTDGNKELGYWCGTFRNLDNESLVEKKAYVMQSNGTFRHIDKIYSTKPNVSSFLAYFSAKEPIGTSFKMKFVITENGAENSDVTDFPADEFYSECDIEEINGVGDVYGSRVQGVQDDVMYNLAGQKVTKDYKGIIIKNGRKMVTKN